VGFKDISIHPLLAVGERKENRTGSLYTNSGLCHADYVQRYATKNAADEAGAESEDDDDLSSVGSFDDDDEEAQPAGQMDDV
jgi:hypothetical protein